MSLLQVAGVTHAFGDHVIFRQTSFRLLAGERVGLVGANGAGKSTLLRILSGAVLPDQGQLEWLSTVTFGYLEQHVELAAGETIRDYLRGAFAALDQVEAELLRVAAQMGDATAELEPLLARYAALQEELERGDFYAIDALVEAVAGGLGLLELGLARDVAHLSGGQRTKLLLAKLLLQKPHVLLLDEPTNYLDHEHIGWLTGYLRSYPHSFVLISHDTAFLNAVVNVVYHLEYQQLTRYVGNYEQFLAAYERRKHQALQAYQQQQREIQKLEDYIAKNKVRASTARQAKSREKRLAKIDRLTKPTGRARPKFQFRVVEEPTAVLLKAEQLVVGYEQALLPPFDVELRRGAKVALVGYNGIGKTTSLRTLLGQLPALSGHVHWGERVQPAYFAQEDESQDTHSALEDIWRAYPALTQQAARTALARCGLTTEHIRQPLHTLSGGEQAKVRLCKLMLADSNWLVLDEPTNHLDVVAKAALQEALIAYPGTILLVSHEPAFYEAFATEVWNVERWRKRS